MDWADLSQGYRATTTTLLRNYSSDHCETLLNLMHHFKPTSMFEVNNITSLTLKNLEIFKAIYLNVQIRKVYVTPKLINPKSS